MLCPHLRCAALSLSFLPHRPAFQEGGEEPKPRKKKKKDGEGKDKGDKGDKGRSSRARREKPKAKPAAKPARGPDEPELPSDEIDETAADNDFIDDDGGCGVGVGPRVAHGGWVYVLLMAQQRVTKVVGAALV